MDFISIDFETANENRASVCAMALIFFEDNQIVDEKEWLIKPPEDYIHFNPLNIQIHGITPEKIENKPEFDKIWPEVKPYIENKLVVAHNAAFDVNVLQRLIIEYNLDSPKFNYVCTYRIATATWEKQFNYSLKNLGNHLGYIFNHHDAHDDAKVCGKIFIHACEKHNVNNVDELAKKINMRIGTFENNHYYNCYVPSIYSGMGKKNNHVAIKDIIAATSYFDTEHPLYNKKVIFTGSLISMTRRNAMQKIVDLGGIIGNSITKDTDFLVMGLQDFSRFIDGKESSKTKAAKQYIEEGFSLQIINEDEFVRMI
jgi:DNA polymerase-3 subunit epsilon